MCAFLFVRANALQATVREFAMLGMFAPTNMIREGEHSERQKGLVGFSPMSSGLAT